MDHRFPPITDEQVRRFDDLVKRWKKILHLMNWRFVRARGRPADCLADVTMLAEDRIVRYRVGRDWGNIEPTDRELELTVIHELLHVVLQPLLKACLGSRDSTPEIDGAEHQVILSLSHALYELAHRGGDEASH